MKTIISFFIGIMLGAVCLSITVFAAGGIKDAFFNDNAISFNGRQLNLGSERMVSVIDVGQESAENYIPIRSTFEELGYSVEWNARQNAVIISNK